ncbi:uncharacterized protein MELLADRAFT_93851 [Melampsora larici-populina 98AG31]|uniref:FAR1 domain-containing protein n=1 Tax=Melampsora larici-populina (strain 98AG31 / pathotype 3-4-7) TaxID=747676 RepID=F4S5H0_MELLP|nr:uncharacterized protein MELLADRAFT_93851 [Melampsora larici-populina 98AG31]EGG00024.1 hypothetical protein MELLADRAFT_93851 [Melampsora larici-populina 98AG31]
MVPAPYPLWNVFPAPPEVDIKGDRKKMDDYVKDFVLSHGYKISIRHSSTDKCNICHYHCHRGGLPHKPKPNTSTTSSITTDEKPSRASRSIKIQCPFHLTAKYNPTTDVWRLTHVQIGHNHEAMSDETPVVNHNPYPPEIISRASRIVELSPRKQGLILQELDSLLDQYTTSAMRTNIIKTDDEAHMSTQNKETIEICVVNDTVMEDNNIVINPGKVLPTEVSKSSNTSGQKSNDDNELSSAEALEDGIPDSVSAKDSQRGGSKAKRAAPADKLSDVKKAGVGTIKKSKTKSHSKKVPLATAPCTRSSRRSTRRVP